METQGWPQGGWMSPEPRRALPGAGGGGWVQPPDTAPLGSLVPVAHQLDLQQWQGSRKGLDSQERPPAITGRPFVCVLFYNPFHRFQKR